MLTKTIRKDKRMLPCSLTSALTPSKKLVEIILSGGMQLLLEFGIWKPGDW